MSTKINIVILIIILISLFSGIIAYPYINDDFASHWNSKGEVNGYMSKLWGVLLLPIIMIFTFLLFRFIPKIDPLKKNVESFKKEFDLFIIGILLFLMYVHILTIIYNLGYIFNLSKTIIPAFGLFFYLIGILLLKLKRNWFIGIKTPWTLSSDYVWQKTHKLGGLLFKVSGIIIALSFFIYKAAYIVLLITVTLTVIITISYSYFVFKKSR